MDGPATAAVPMRERGGQAREPNQSEPSLARWRFRLVTGDASRGKESDRKD